MLEKEGAGDQDVLRAYKVSEEHLLATRDQLLLFGLEGSSSGLWRKEV